MSTLPTARSLPPSAVRGVAFSPASAAALAGLLTVLGITCIWSTGQSLWDLWTTDALKSIGMVIPVVSFLLIARAWRSLAWETDGSWWGFGLLLATSIVVKMREQSILVFVLSPQWSIYIPPPSLVVFAYAVGLVLLFGGRRLLHASVFPLLLLLFVNPVPHVFNVYVDLPLQRASAHIARGFAMALGQPLSPDKLRLMFTPEFGMFIAPGCNGIRGAVTMGLIALVAGYLYQFRWRALSLVVLGAVLLGYIFNFVRLCVLVLYYILALHVPMLQDQAENADYAIGAALFFLAVYLLYAVIQRLGTRAGVQAGVQTEVQPGVLALPQVEAPQPVANSGFYLRAAALSVLVAVGMYWVVSGILAPGPGAELRADETAMGQFPQTVGHYTLARRWNETLLTGALLFHWAEYAPENGGGGAHISVGVSPLLGSHDTLVCHSARGEDPLWHGETRFGTAGDGPVNFSASFFNDGTTQYLEATTLCNGTNCGEYSSPRGNFGLVYSRPQASTLLSQNGERPIPILLKVETIDTTLPPDVARQQLSSDLTSFLSGVNLNLLTRPYRRQ
jgi:exosortase J